MSLKSDPDYRRRRSHTLNYSFVFVRGRQFDLDPALDVAFKHACRSEIFRGSINARGFYLRVITSFPRFRIRFARLAPGRVNEIHFLSFAVAGFIRKKLRITGRNRGKEGLPRT